MRAHEFVTETDHDLDEVHSFIYNEITPGDVGKDRVGDYVVYFEGFNEDCLDDVYRRMDLDTSDPEYVTGIEQVYAQVWKEFEDKAGQTAIENDAIDYEDGQAICYSIFYMPESLNETGGTGRVVKGVNTTPDVGPNEITKQAAKFKIRVNRDGYPPVARSDGKIPRS
jgi:hypothetical protein